MRGIAWAGDRGARRPAGGPTQARKGRTASPEIADLPGFLAWQETLAGCRGSGFHRALGVGTAGQEGGAYPEFRREAVFPPDTLEQVYAAIGGRGEGWRIKRKEISGSSAPAPVPSH